MVNAQSLHPRLVGARRDQVRLTHAQGEGGAVAVEFALIVPLLLLIVFGLINFGIIFSQQLTMNNAVRDGARKAVVNDAGSPGRTCNGILANVHNQLAGLSINPADVEVRVTQDGWTNANGCGTTFQKTTFGGRSGSIPCLGSFATATNTARSIIVEARYVADIAVSVPPFPTTITLASKGVYRCEFSF